MRVFYWQTCIYSLLDKIMVRLPLAQGVKNVLIFSRELWTVICEHVNLTKFLFPPLKYGTSDFHFCLVVYRRLYAQSTVLIIREVSFWELKIDPGL